MSHPRRHVLFALLFAVLLAATLTIPHRMDASPVADFAAPMSAQAAQARVRVATGRHAAPRCDCAQSWCHIGRGVTIRPEPVFFRNQPSSE